MYCLILLSLFIDITNTTPWVYFLLYDSIIRVTRAIACWVSLSTFASPQSEPELFLRHYTLLANNTVCGTKVSQKTSQHSRDSHAPKTCCPWCPYLNWFSIGLYRYASPLPRPHYLSHFWGGSTIVRLCVSRTQRLYQCLSTPPFADLPEAAFICKWLQPWLHSCLSTIVSREPNFLLQLQCLMSPLGTLLRSPISI